MLSPDVTAILESAVADTRARRHHELTLEHLLLAIVKHPAGTQILRACKVDLDAVRGELERHLGNRPGTQLVDVIQSQEFQRTLQRAASHVQGAGRTELTTGNLLVAILAEREAYGTFLLERAGLTKISLVTHVCHGAGDAVRPAELPQARLLGRWRPQQQATSPEHLYSVVFHDDEYTTRDFVVALLTSMFAQSPADAAAVMESTQQRGIGMVGAYSLEDATALLEDATRRARKAEFPLKLTLVPTAIAPKR